MEYVCMFIKRNYKVVRCCCAVLCVPTSSLSSSVPCGCCTCVTCSGFLVKCDLSLSDTLSFLSVCEIHMVYISCKNNAM